MARSNIEYRLDAPVHLVNKHGRLVAVRADQVCAKIAQGVYDWPDFEDMKASDVQALVSSIPGLEYTKKEEAIDELKKRAGGIVVHQATTPRAQGGWLEDPPKQLRHQNYALAVSSIQRMLRDLKIKGLELEF